MIAVTYKFNYLIGIFHFLQILSRVTGNVLNTFHVPFRFPYNEVKTGTAMLRDR